MLGLLLLVRRRNPQRNRNTLIDAAILTLGLSLLSWVLQIAPYLHDGSLELLPKLVSVAYPLGDIILLLAAVIRLVLDAGRRRPSFYLLSASIVSLLCTDFVYGVMTLDNAFHHQLLLDLGWFSYQLLWGTAALHPSMVALDEPVTESRRGQADAAAPGSADRRLADRADVHPAEGAAPRRSRPDRDHLRLGGPVRLRRDAHGRTRAPAGALGRT